MSVNKLIKKLKHQEKVNPGHKEAYTPPCRPRSTIFNSKKNYNRKSLGKVVYED